MAQRILLIQQTTLHSGKVNLFRPGLPYPSLRSLLTQWMEKFWSWLSVSGVVCVETFLRKRRLLSVSRRRMS